MLTLPLVLNQPPPPAIDSAARACSAALVDLRALPPDARPFQRYLWSLDGTKQTWAACSLAVNAALSHSPVAIVPVDLYGGRLIRLDLRLCCPEAADFKRLYETWESLAAADPYFHLTSVKLVNVPRYRHADGRWYTQAWKSAVVAAPHAGADHVALIAEAASAAPILRADWWLTKVLSTTDGGKYYDFRGIRGKTFAQYLAGRGASEQQVAALRTDERAVLLISQVTGKPRRIDFFQGSGARPSVASGLVFITRDRRDQNTAAEFDPLLNLLRVRDDASEVIVELPNGQLEYTLWDAAGKLQDEVPPDVAADHEIPEPHTRRLQPAIGCIRCHGKQGGWWDFSDDVKLVGKSGLFPLLDASVADQSEAAIRLRGLFGGDPADVLRGAKLTYAQQVFRTTGGLTPEAAAKAVADSYAAHEYAAVTPEIAAKELGLAAFDLPPTDPEDPRIGALRSGLAIGRDQWEQVYGDAAARAAAREN